MTKKEQLGRDRITVDGNCQKSIRSCKAVKLERKNALGSGQGWPGFRKLIYKRNIRTDSTSIHCHRLTKLPTPNCSHTK